MGAENLYLDLYAVFAEDSEYLQPDGGSRSPVTDMLIMGAMGGALASFTTGFFTRLGERAADGVAGRIVSLLRRGERKDVIRALALLEPYLPELSESLEDERLAEEAWVSSMLYRLGFPETTAHEVAGAVLDRLREQGRRQIL